MRRQAAALLVVLLSRLFAPAAAMEFATPEIHLAREQEQLLGEFRTIRPDGRSGDGVWMLDVWDSDSGLGNLAPPAGGPGNAAADFHRLETLFPRERETLAAGDNRVSGVEVLIAAAGKAACRLVPDYYEPFDKTTAKQPDFAVLRSYLNALLSRADDLARSGDAAGAEKLYQAGLACGRHLVNAKSSHIVYLTGLLFKLRSAQAYEKFLLARGRTDDKATIASYIERLTMLIRAFHWKANTAMGTFPGFASLPVLLEVAAKDKEACWRQEAVLRLGIFRHGAPDMEKMTLERNPAWEKAAETALATAAESDPDPTVRRLAAWTIVNVKPDRMEELRQVQ